MIFEHIYIFRNFHEQKLIAVHLTLYTTDAVKKVHDEIKILYYNA